MENENKNENDVSIATGLKQEFQSKTGNILTPELKLSTIGLKLSELKSELSNYAHGSDIDLMDTRSDESRIVEDIQSLLQVIKDCLSRDDLQRKEFLEYFPKTLADLSAKRGGYDVSLTS